MKNLLLVLICVMLVGCYATTVHQVTAPNRANLIKLSIGMSKNEAISIMGTTPFSAGGFNFTGGQTTRMTINNPYRSEILQGKNKTLEVVYYVTDVKSDDGAITDDELFPLVFDEGKLIGWGWSFLQDNIQKYEIRVR